MRENRSLVFMTRSVTDQPVQSQNISYKLVGRRETICVAKTKALISCAVTAQLICVCSHRQNCFRIGINLVFS